MAQSEWYVGSPREPYDQSKIPPSWVELQTTILHRIYNYNQTAWEAGTPTFDLLIIGKLYCNSDEISGITKHVESPQELWDLYVQFGDDAEKAVQAYLDMDCKPEIYGFVVREV